MITGDEFIYLDNNATTPPDPAVIEEMLPFLTKCYAILPAAIHLPPGHEKLSIWHANAWQRCSDANRRKLFSPAAAQNLTMR
jgi:hypothetical protein